MKLIRQALKKLLYNNNKKQEAEDIKAEMISQVETATTKIIQIDSQIRQTTAYRIGRASGGFK